MRKGFTLIEVLVSISIFSFIIAGIYAVLNMADKTYHEDMGLVGLQQKARQAMGGMVRELRQSSRTIYNIDIDNDGTGVTFSIPDIPNIRYYLDANSHQVIRQQPEGTGPLQVLANDINTLNFCWWDGVDCCNQTTEDCSSLQVLQVQIRARKTVRGRTLVFPLILPLTEQVGLRN